MCRTEKTLRIGSRMDTWDRYVLWTGRVQNLVDRWSRHEARRSWTFFVFLDTKIPSIPSVFDWIWAPAAPSQTLPGYVVQMLKYTNFCQNRLKYQFSGGHPPTLGGVSYRDVKLSRSLRYLSPMSQDAVSRKFRKLLIVLIKHMQKYSNWCTVLRWTSPQIQ